jgi:hypothetical protein
LSQRHSGRPKVDLAFNRSREQNKIEGSSHESVRHPAYQWTIVRYDLPHSPDFSRKGELGGIILQYPEF